MSDLTYRLLDDGRFAYRYDQLWEQGAHHFLGQLCEFRDGDPSSRAVVSEMTDTEVIFEMLGRPVVDVTGGRMA